MSRRDHRLLGGRRHTRDAQATRPGSLVHCTAGGQRGVLTVLGQRDAEALGVVQRPPHEGAVLHTRSVVGEQRHAEVRQLAERRQRLPGATNRDGPRHRDLGHATNAEREDLRRHAGGVDGRIGVGHGDDRRVAAQRGRPSPRLDRFGLLASRLAQVRVQVDQARADEASDRVQDTRAGGRLNGLVHADHGARSNSDVTPGQAPGPDHRAATYHQCDVRQRLAPPMRRGSRLRGARRGWPCARRRRWPPAGSRPCAASPPRRTRFPRRAPWDPDG